VRSPLLSILASTCTAHKIDHVVACPGLARLIVARVPETVIWPQEQMGTRAVVATRIGRRSHCLCRLIDESPKVLVDALHSENRTAMAPCCNEPVAHPTQVWKRKAGGILLFKSGIITLADDFLAVSAERSTIAYFIQHYFELSQWPRNLGIFGPDHEFALWPGPFRLAPSRQLRADGPLNGVARMLLSSKVIFFRFFSVAPAIVPNRQRVRIAGSKSPGGTKAPFLKRSYADEGNRFHHFHALPVLLGQWPDIVIQKKSRFLVISCRIRCTHAHKRMSCPLDLTICCPSGPMESASLRSR
jgi:hypothetical protein